MSPLSRLISLACFLPFIFSACTSNKSFQKALYFKDSITEDEKKVINNPVAILPGDRLSIAITAINKEAADAFNTGMTAGGTTAGYLVDSSGNIQLLQLGTVHTAGLTTSALRDSLQNQLINYLKGPMVTVSIINFQVNMMGEIGRPGVLAVPDGNINILQAITQSGDLKDDARRDNILVIRQVNGQREFGRVDISSNHVFESPYFYLKQNDIVYIEPDRGKYITSSAQTTRIIRNFGFIITALSTIILLKNLFQ